MDKPISLTLRLSKNLHKDAAKFAGKCELSVAAYIRQALLEKITREKKERK
jgi:predicted HicB family RNase H-like nuclease